MEFARRKRRHTHNTIAPLVDVVFLLLLFFVLTFHILPEQSMHIDLPDSSTATDRPDQGISIAVAASGQILLNDIEADLSTLKARLIDIHGASPGSPVRIEADRNSNVGLLVTVMDAVRKAGFASFDLMADPE